MVPWTLQVFKEGRQTKRVAWVNKSFHPRVYVNKYLLVWQFGLHSPTLLKCPVWPVSVAHHCEPSGKSFL